MSNSEGEVVIVPGRIIWISGDLFKGKVKTIFGSQTPQLNQSGEQTLQYGFGLSVPKSELADPIRGAIWAAMYEQAYTMFPSRQIPPSFAMKFKDGDGSDDNGQPFNLREGYAGCVVFALTTNIPIRFFKWENGQNVLISEGIKCGDYVNCQVRVKAHAAIGQGKAGLYLNPLAVQLVAPGKEIINAPTGDQVFGTSLPQAPVGYVAPAQPTMPNPMMPGAPVAAAPSMNMGQTYPAQPPVNVASPSNGFPTPTPNYAVIPPAHQPPAPGGQYPPHPGVPR